MSNLKVFFICLVAVSTIRAEFLFEKSVAADDKFLCLHKKLYRREKPAASSNPARILSQMRMLQSLPSSYPAGMPAEYQTDYNGMYVYLSENINAFTPSDRSLRLWLTELYNTGYIDFFKSDQFKALVKDAVEGVYQNFVNTNQLASNPPTSGSFATAVGAAVKVKIDQMMKDYLLQYNIDQAMSDGISYNKVVYVMLNILDLFKEDVKIARTAYEDAYSSNKDQVKGTEAINSAAVIRWIESIRTRYAQLKANPTPDTQEILAPFYEEGFINPETPTGNFIEPIDTPAVPQPSEINEPEPVPTFPTVNENLLIPDLIIEIQRTYNVQKMLLAYNQLPQVLRSDIDSCKLNLGAAMTRCETAHGTGNCEAISGVAVNQKCPAGTMRQGCCKCVAQCDSSLYYTTARGFCKHKSDLHHVPAIVAAGSASNGQTVVTGLNIAVSACKDGFSRNKFVCYRSCPAGTRAIGGATCLKDQPTILGSPFVWTAGDE